jgi:hypothetical protein
VTEQLAGIACAPAGTASTAAAPIPAATSTRDITFMYCLPRNTDDQPGGTLTTASVSPAT